MNQQIPSVPEPPSPPEKATQPPWSLGDIVICVVGGVVFGFVVLFMVGVVLGSIFGRPRDSVLYLLSGGTIYLFVGLFIWLRLVKNRGVGWREIGFVRVRPVALILMIPLTLALLISTALIAELTHQLLNDVPDAADQLSVSSSDDVSALDLFCLLTVVAVIGPVIEEIVFRGLLQPYLKARRGVGLALVITSLAFAAIHFIPALLAVFFVMGLAFGLVAEKSRSLYPAILLHSLNNAVSVLLVVVAVN